MSLNRDRYAKIWDKTKGTDVEKAHAVLSFYFESPFEVTPYASFFDNQRHLIKSIANGADKRILRVNC